jgi:hypothetical protein
VGCLLRGQPPVQNVLQGRPPRMTGHGEVANRYGTVESHQPVEERRTINRSTVRLTTFRTVPAGAQSHIQILPRSAIFPARGLCQGSLMRLSWRYHGANKCRRRLACRKLGRVAGRNRNKTNRKSGRDGMSRVSKLTHPGSSSHTSSPAASSRNTKYPQPASSPKPLVSNAYSAHSYGA